MQWLRRRRRLIVGLVVIGILLCVDYRYRVRIAQMLPRPKQTTVVVTPAASSKPEGTDQPEQRPASAQLPVSEEAYDQAVHRYYALEEAGEPIPARLQKFVDDAYKSGVIVGTDPAKAAKGLPNAEYDLMPRWQVGLVGQRCNWYTDRAAKNLQGQIDAAKEAEEKRDRARWLWPLIIFVVLGLIVLAYFLLRGRWPRNLTLPVPGAPQGVPPGGAIDPQAR